ncbi:MAG: cation:proton antiporter [Candidatus Paceibacterota bacterium]
MKLHAESLFITQSIILIGLPYAIWRMNKIKKYMPLVVIQILFGILLGPSVLGKLFPSMFETLFPASSLDIINGLAWIAIIFFVFMTGMHLDLNEIRGKGKSFAVVSLSSIFVPFVAATLVGLLIARNYPVFIGTHGTPTTFALALGIAAGITALPVLGAILIDMKLVQDPIGKTALGYATVNDGALWILVSILLTLVQGNMDIASVARTILLAGVYIAALALVVRPFLCGLLKRGMLTNEPDNGQMVLLSCFLLLSSLITDLIGIHYVMGAFAFGAIIPKEMADSIHHKIDTVISVVLLPFFFIITGLKTQFDAGAAEVWILFAIMTVISSSGKIFGTALPARRYGCSWKDALTLGGFMQCNGLMEIVVLSMMLQAGVISPIAFSGMVFMAIATTALTKPSVLLVDKMSARRRIRNNIKPCASANFS